MSERTAAAAPSAPDLEGISRKNPQNDYQLVRKIGGGTYGEVYEALRIVDRLSAAIKIIKFEPGDDLTVILQEIHVMRGLNHSNIVQYYGAYLRRDRLWICMEFCSAGSIQDLYHAAGPLTEPQIGYVSRETVRGLAYLHGMQKMHRDIKGANILLTDRGDVKLADFGVSAQITSTLSKRKSFIGSPFWMSPEIAAVERKGGYNQQCDIWSMGITAIEMAELQPPMFDLHPMRALYLLSKSKFKPPTLKEPEKWTKDFRDFIKQTLTKDPKKRPTANQLLNHAFVMRSSLGPQVGRELIATARNPQLKQRRPGTAAEILAQQRQNSKAGSDDDEDEILDPADRLKHRILPKRPPPPPSEQLKQQPVLAQIATVAKPNPPARPPPPAAPPRPPRRVDVQRIARVQQVDSRTQEQQLSPKQQGLLESVMQEVELRVESHRDAQRQTELAQAALISNNKQTPPNHQPYTDPNFHQSQRLRSNNLYKIDEAQLETSPSATVVRETAIIEPETGDKNKDDGGGGEGTLVPGQYNPAQLNPDAVHNKPSATEAVRPTANGHQPTTIATSNSVFYTGQNGHSPQTPHKPVSVMPSDHNSRNISSIWPQCKTLKGAGLIKIFNDCPLHINCTAAWTHPETRAQFLLVGADEGLYTYNLNELHEPAMDELHPRRCIWMCVVDDILMTMSGGKNSNYLYLYRHDLVALHKLALQTSTNSTLKRMQSHLLTTTTKFLPRRFAVSTKISETRGCIKCCVARHSGTLSCYLACALPHEIVLLKWYEPMSKFAVLKKISWVYPLHLNVFTMFINERLEYPMLCVGVRYTPATLAFMNSNSHTLEDDNVNDDDAVDELSQHFDYRLTFGAENGGDLEFDLIDFSELTGSSPAAAPSLTPARSGVTSNVNIVVEKQPQNQQQQQHKRELSDSSSMQSTSSDVALDRSMSIVSLQAGAESETESCSSAQRVEQLDGNQTLTQPHQPLRPDELYPEVGCIEQLDKESIVVAYKNVVKIVDMSGSVRRLEEDQPAAFLFDFKIIGLKRLSERQLLVFHKHGLQGLNVYETGTNTTNGGGSSGNHSYAAEEAAMTLTLSDESRVYRLLGTDGQIVLESKSISNRSDNFFDETCDLHVVAGCDDETTTLSSASQNEPGFSRSVSDSGISNSSHASSNVISNDQHRVPPTLAAHGSSKNPFWENE